MLALLLLASFAAPQQPGDGFTLFAPIPSTTTYLLDNSGDVVHTWPSAFEPGDAVYLRGNGNLLRTMHTTGQIGGSGGKIQEIAWDGTVVWDWDLDTGGRLSHHDIEILPNGNLLVVAWQDYTDVEAIQAGRDPSLIFGSVLRSELILEVEPTGPTTADIVWEWNAWDHLIQDFDAGADNFGVVGDFPELLDLNWPPEPNLVEGDWVHVNSVAYNEELDQIVLSANRFDEIWVIDHSTTTAEAAGHTGGNSGMGGDILYRWGNPQAYDHGDETDRILFGQHDANWIPAGLDAGDLLIFNNGDGRLPEFSDVLQITPPLNASNLYDRTPGAAFGPASTSWSYEAPIPTDFYTNFMGGAERLSNGNTLICSAQQGWFFEVDASGTMVWEYHNVFPSPGSNVFKVRRYKQYLFANAHEISAGSGGVIDFKLIGGTDNAMRAYILVGTSSGTTPGTPLPGGNATIPINQDFVTDLILATLNGPSFQNFGGTLNGLGNGLATLDTLGPITPGMIGQTLHFAYTVTNPYDWTSNPVAIDIVP